MIKLIIILFLYSGTVLAEILPVKFSYTVHTGAEICESAKGSLGWFPSRDAAHSGYLAGVTLANSKCSPPAVTGVVGWQSDRTMRYWNQMGTQSKTYWNMTFGIGCPDGGALIGNNLATWACEVTPPSCVQPDNHPCDIYPESGTFSGEKYLTCRLNVEFDLEDCTFKHKYGCTNSDGYSGPFGGYFQPDPNAVLGSHQCVYGCEYVVDELDTYSGGMHVTLNGLTCSNTVANIPNTEYKQEDIVNNDNTWEPENDPTKPNCGEFNGEFICLDSIESGTCVTTPNGAIVCVSPPDVVPDSPVPLDPDIKIRIPGDDPDIPSDDEDIDIYRKPPTGTIPECPTGSIYVNGRCIHTPNPDGSCPDGYILYGDQCVFSGSLGGPFAGPSGSLGGGLGGPPSFSYLDTLNTFYDKVRNSPLLDFSPNCGTGSSSCPSLTVLGTTTRIHCDLAENAVPIFSAFLWLVGGLVAIRAVFSA